MGKTKSSCIQTDIAGIGNERAAENLKNEKLLNSDQINSNKKKNPPSTHALTLDANCVQKAIGT